MLSRGRAVAIVAALAVPVGVAVAVSPAAATAQQQRCWTTPDGVCSKPYARTWSALHRRHHSARLNGQVRRGGLPTTYYFVYGRHARGGRTSPHRRITGGHDMHRVTFLARHLKAHTRYYYRLIARNRMGTSRGISRWFTTR